MASNVPGPGDVRHNEAASRFEAIIEGQLCRADYRRESGPHGDVLRIFHTEVPMALEGRGIAGTIVRAAIDFARANDLKIEPACSYVRAYMRRHPESADVLAPGARV